MHTLSFPMDFQIIMKPHQASLPPSSCRVELHWKNEVGQASTALRSSTEGWWLVLPQPGAPQPACVAITTSSATEQCQIDQPKELQEKKKYIEHC